MQIQRVQREVSTQRFCDYVEGLRSSIDHRSAGNSLLRKVRAIGGLGRPQGSLPQRFRGQTIAVKSVHGVVLGRDIDYVVRATGDVANTGNKQRLRVYLAINWVGKQPPEGGRIDVGGSQDRFIGIQASALPVVVIGEHCKRTSGCNYGYRAGPDITRAVGCSHRAAAGLVGSRVQTSRADRAARGRPCDGYVGGELLGCSFLQSHGIGRDGDRRGHHVH